MNSSIKFYANCVLIVLYNCALKDCTTLKTLLSHKALLGHERWCVVVWNNGPISNRDYRKELDQYEFPENIDLFYAEDLGNAPLALLYNRFIGHFNAERYILFDQDSTITSEYFSNFKGSASDLLVPKICAKGEIHGPIFGKRVVTSDGVIPINGRTWFFAVASGMCIGKNLVFLLKKKYGAVFDERYALYGVDTTFGMRINCIARSHSVVVTCQGGLFHSLSRLEAENPKMKIFRARERGLDIGITLRCYFSKKWMRVFITCLLARIRKDHRVSLRWLLYGFLFGKHPRVKNYNLEAFDQVIEALR